MSSTFLVSIGLRGRGGGGRSGGARSDRSLLSTRTGDRGHAVGGLDPGQTDRRHPGCRCCPACSDGRNWFGLSLKSWAADKVMPLPVFMLAEGAAVASGVAATACLASFAATVPATLEGERRGNRKFSREYSIRKEMSRVQICVSSKINAETSCELNTNTF